MALPHLFFDASPVMVVGQKASVDSISFIDTYFSFSKPFSPSLWLAVLAGIVIIGFVQRLVDGAFNVRSNSLDTTHYSLLATHHSPLTTHYSLLTTHHSPLTTHNSLLTTHYSPLHQLPLTIHYSLLTTHYSLLTIHYSLFTTHYSLLTTHYSLLTTHYSLLTTHCPLPATHYPLLTTQHFYFLPSPYYSLLSTAQVACNISSRTRSRSFSCDCTTPHTSSCLPASTWERFLRACLIWVEDRYQVRSRGGGEDHG